MPTQATAQQADDPRIEPVTVKVTGRRPGPPLWKVRNGANVLYIFGYLSPLPKRMRWESDHVAEVLSSAQEFISMPVFGWSSSLPRDATRLPYGKRLQDVLPSQAWEQYLRFAEDHFKRSRAIERMRPVLAVSALTNSVYGRHDLVSGQKVLNAIEKLAGRNRSLKRTDPNLVWPQDLKARIDKASAASVATISTEQELACFEAGLERVIGNINVIKQAANFWADADVPELGLLLDRRQSEPAQPPDTTNLQNACSLSVILDPVLRAEASAFVEKQRDNWLNAVETALASNTTTFAVLDVNMLLGSSSLLDVLRDRGYEVQVPGLAESAPTSL